MVRYKDDLRSYLADPKYFDDVEQEDFLISVVKSYPGLNVGNLADILTGEIISGSSKQCKLKNIPKN